MDVSFLSSILPTLLAGTLVTLQIAFFSTMLGLVGGIILGIAHATSTSLIKKIITLWVTIIRGTPMLIQVSFVYLLLPEIGINLPSIACAIVAIGMNSSAYISQIIKAGILSIDKGQREAAHVLGLSEWQTMRFVILPQAIRAVIPSLLNEGITLLKDSSLASTIGVVELFKASSRIINVTYQPIPVYCIMACIYLTLTTILSLITHHVQRKINTHAHH